MDSTRTNDQSHEASLTPFPAANDDYRYLRKRATVLCAAFNAQPLDVSDKERDQAWNEYGFVWTIENCLRCANHSLASLAWMIRVTKARPPLRL